MLRGAALTSRGWGLLGAALALAAGGYLFGMPALYPLAGGCAILVLAARAWVGGVIWDVRLTRSIRPARVPEGTEARVLVSAYNHDRRRSPVVVVRDRFEGGGPAATFAVAPLEPGGSRSASYRLVAPRRGLYHLRPLEVELCDPFGLARVSRVASPGTSLTVHPRVEAVDHRWIPSSTDTNPCVPLPVPAAGGDEFYGLRGYQAGDDLRRVHWPSSARANELVVRQAENLWRGRTTVAIDARSASHSPATFEQALSAAASLALAALSADIQIRVVASGGLDTGFGAGDAHRAAVLDILASASIRPGEDLAGDLRRARVSGALVLITTDAISVAELGAATRLAGRDSVSVVVFPRLAAGGSPDLRPNGIRTVVIPPGGSFPAAWAGSAGRPVPC